MRRVFRYLAKSLFAVALTVFSFFPISSAQAQDASIHFEVFRAGFIIGAGGGSGTLYFNDKGYRVEIGGVSLGATIDLARTELVGNVFNLTRPEDINGTYTAVGGSAVLAGGASGVEMQNSRGVRMILRGRSVGLKLSLDLSGMTITLR